MNVSNFWQRIMYLNSDFDFQRKKNTKRIECSVLVFQRVLKRVFLLLYIKRDHSLLYTYIIFLNFCQIISRYIVNYDETNKMKLKQRPELNWICYYLSIYLSQKLVACLLIP